MHMHMPHGVQHAACSVGVGMGMGMGVGVGMGMGMGMGMGTALTPLRSRWSPSSAERLEPCQLAAWW